ncbi:MAG: hypothetical protein COA88_01000 [Kordia sp.]|nr:MAG: hypothetical protein COA88_01000 [Kordia sp.]
MTNYLIIFMGFLFGGSSVAQKHEVGLFLGGSNVISDVGSTDVINPNDVVIGGVYKWNRTPRYSFRLSVNYANVHGEDSKSNDSKQRARDYSFRNAIKEVSVGIEYNLINFDLHDRNRLFTKITPYVYSGLSFFHYDALYLKGGKTVQKFNSHSTFAIPLSLGVKTTLSSRFILGFETGVRYTFTDDLDGSNPVRDKAPYESLKFGNTKNNDWYVFTGVTLTYTFGKKPCICPEGNKY